MKDGTVLLFFWFSPHFFLFFPQFSIQFRGHYGLPPLVSVISTGVHRSQKNKQKKIRNPPSRHGEDSSPSQCGSCSGSERRLGVLYITDRLRHAHSRQVVGGAQSGGVQLAPWGALVCLCWRGGEGGAGGSAIRSCWGLCHSHPPARSSAGRPPVLFPLVGGAR